jgi:hypothetical protein
MTVPVDIPHNVSVSAKRRGLEARADYARARLLTTLAALQRRKQTLLDPAAELRRHPEVAIGVGGGLAVAFGLGVGAVAYRMATRKERARRARWDAWVRLLAHPERSTRKPAGFALGIVEKGLSAAVTAAVAAVAKHLVEQALHDVDAPIRPQASPPRP